MRKTSTGIIFTLALWTAFGCGSSQSDKDVGGASPAGETPSDGGGGAGGRTAAGSVGIADMQGSTAGSAGASGEGGEPDSPPSVGVLLDSNDPSVPCGALACSGEKSICCWDWVSSTGECVSEASGCPTYALACDSRSDCGAAYCCASSFRTECLDACAPGMVAYCAAPSDCPSLPDQVASCQAINDESLPFSTGYCVYGP